MTDNHSEVSAATWERLSLLFESAISLPRDQRASFVDAECAGDASLRAELAGLLASADDAPEFLRAFASDVLAPAFAAATVDRSATDRSSALPSRAHVVEGSRVRHYDVCGRLGAGGMGVVYRGLDTRLGRDVALKFLPPEQFADQAARRRLVREAQAASALDDPHVCAMHAIEDTDDGGLCLVMGYCAGGTLRDRLRAGLLPSDVAIDIARQLASGLASAHRRNIVHRDIKPANVGFSEGNVAKILDFGVAVRADIDASVDDVGGRALAGTLPYMAPELLRGGAADASADVWALGVVIYEMLTGRRPFVGPTQAALLQSILESEPAPLTRADGAPLPEGVSTLVRDMLQKLPVRRPNSADEVSQRLRALEVAVADQPPLPAGDGDRSGSMVFRRWPVMVALASVAVVAAVVTMRRGADVAIATRLEVSRSDDPLPTIAVLPFAVRGGPELEYLREGMVDLLTPVFDATGLLHGIDPNTVIGAASQHATATIDSATAQSLAVRVGARRYVVGSVVRAGTTLTVRATLYHADGQDAARAQVTVDDANSLTLGIESLVRQLVGAELHATGDAVAGLAAAMTTSTRALRAYLDGERELRDARPASAVALFSSAVADDSLFALAWYRLARAARWSEVDSLNIVATERAFRLASRLPLRLQQLVHGYHELRMGSPAAAERQFRQIVTDYPTDVDAWMLLGETLFDNNPYVGRPSSEAEGAFRRVMALDPRNREVTVYLMDLAARRGELGALDTLFRMYFRPNSAGEQPGIRQAYLALHARRLENSERSIDDPVGAQLALRRAGAEPSDLRAARRFAATLAAPSNNAKMRVEGLLDLTTLDVADGRMDSARQHWREAALLDAEATLRHRALMYAVPTFPVNADTLRALRQGLARLSLAVTPKDNLTPDERAALHVYLGGLLSARLGDTSALARARQQLSSGRTHNRLSAALSYALGGHLAHARGNAAAAVLSFERSAVDIPFHVRALIPALGQQADRFAHAEALQSVGRADEARRWYASLRDGPALWSAPYLALVASRLAAKPVP